MKTEGEKATKVLSCWVRTKKAGACTIATMWSRFIKHTEEGEFNCFKYFIEIF